MQLKLKLSKSQKIFLVAILLSIGVGGVTAATTIGINSSIPLNLGAGYSSTITCDSSVDIAKILSGTNALNYRYAGFTLTNIDTTASGCANQILRLAVLDRYNNLQQASWVLPSSATTYRFILGTSNLGQIVGNDYYATYSFASIDISDLSKFAISIGKI